MDQALNGPDQVARFAGEACFNVLQVDAAIIDLRNGGYIPSGPVTPQQLLDAFKVEIQPPGTHGFIGVMTAEIPSTEWARLSIAMRYPFILVARPSPPTSGKVRIAIQRRAGMHPNEYLPLLPKLESLRFEMEMWEVLYQHLTQTPVDQHGPNEAMGSNPRGRHSVNAR